MGAVGLRSRLRRIAVHMDPGPNTVTSGREDDDLSGGAVLAGSGRFDTTHWSMGLAASDRTTARPVFGAVQGPAR